jgi:hypothetical protein
MKKKGTERRERWVQDAYQMPVHFHSCVWEFTIITPNSAFLVPQAEVYKMYPNL